MQNDAGWRLKERDGSGESDRRGEGQDGGRGRGREQKVRKSAGNDLRHRNLLDQSGTSQSNDLPDPEVQAPRVSSGPRR